MSASRSQSLDEKLAGHEKSVANSELYAHTLTLLKSLAFTKIRCLALGSPTKEFQAIYQLAYLKLIATDFDIYSASVSLYDPAFSLEDISFLTSVLGYKVESPEEHKEISEDTETTLFYMPHAPRSLAEAIIAQYNPRWLLANDISVTMGTLTKAKFLQDFPNLATLVHLYEKKDSSSQGKASADDGFVTVTSRKRRNRPRKNVYVEPALEYDMSSAYFCDIDICRVKANPDAVWKDSFSDLALNTVIARPASSPSGKK